MTTPCPNSLAVKFLILHPSQKNGKNKDKKKKTNIVRTP